MTSVNWRAAVACARENDIVVLFGIQAGTALLLASLACLMGRKIVAVSQTMPAGTERRRRWWVRALKGWILRRCNVHVYQTPATRETLLDVYGVKEDRLVFAPFEAGWRVFEGLRTKTPEKPMRLRHPLGWQDSDCVFLFVGTLLRFKGVSTILHALRKLKDQGITARAVFCGPDAESANEPSAREYEAEAASLSLSESVLFAGGVPYQELVHWYRDADVCVLPTARDMWPKVLIEAAALEKPLITTTSCGASGSLVRDGETGRIIPPGNVEALATAMEDLLDPERRHEMGKQARAFCVEFCDAKKEAAGYVTAMELARAA